VLIEATANEHCRAAGSITAEHVRRAHEQQRRQIGSLISSIVGDVSSVLSSNGITVPTAVIESVAGSVVGALPTAQSADATSIAAEITASTGAGEGGSRSSSSVVVTTSTATGSVSSLGSTGTQEPSLSTNSSSSKSDSGPSTGLIAGVVVGGIAALALIGIFVLLLLRHRKKKKDKSKTANFSDKEASPVITSSTEYTPSLPPPSPPPINDGLPARFPQSTYPPTAIPRQTNTPSTLPVALTSPVSPLTQGQQTPWASASPATAATGHAQSAALRYSSEDEKPAQQHQFSDSKIPPNNEMPTSANVWEIGGREIPRPSELDAGKRDGLNLGNVGGEQTQGGHVDEEQYPQSRPPDGADDKNGEDKRSGDVGVAL